MKRATKKQSNRENLLNQGVSLLMEKGYHGTGLKEILDLVQVPKGSFYNYFDSKEAFAAEAVIHYILPYLHRFESHLDLSQSDAMAGMNAYLQEMITELEQNQFRGGCLLGNLVGEIGETSELCRQALKESFHRYCLLWERAIHLAQVQGQIRADKPANVLANLWVNAWQGALLRMKVEQSTAPLAQCVEYLLWDFFKVR